MKINDFKQLEKTSQRLALEKLILDVYESGKYCEFATLYNAACELSGDYDICIYNEKTFHQYVNSNIQQGFGKVEDFLQDLKIVEDQPLETFFYYRGSWNLVKFNLDLDKAASYIAETMIEADDTFGLEDFIDV